MKKKIFDIIFNQTPHIYGLIYLGLIPTFALIYTFLPEHFFHSTVKYEFSILNTKADSILHELKSQIQDNYKNNILNSGQNSSERILDIDEISLSSLKYENNKFYFKFCYSELLNIHKLDSDYAYSRRCYDLSFPSMPFLITVDPLGNTQNIYREIFNESQIKSDSIYFRSRFKEIFKADSIFMPILLVNKTLNDELNEFASTVYGFPTSFKDNFCRMFYFSSVTLTTLGFGDIVPLTNTSRTIISLEAILGIVVIGLFLNALSKRIK